MFGEGVKGTLRVTFRLCALEGKHRLAQIVHSRVRVVAQWTMIPMNSPEVGWQLRD